MTNTWAPEAVDAPDFTDPATFVDGVPFDAFDRIRSTPGLHWQPAATGTAHGGFWVLTRTADCVEVEKDPELFTATRGAIWPLTNRPVEDGYPSQLMWMDPPRHSNVRRIVAKAFGPRIVANFDPWVRAVVTEVIDAIPATDTFDYVQDVAVRIPSQVVARVMGIPRADEGLIIESTTDIFAASQLGDRDQVVAQLKLVKVKLFDYITDVLMPMKRANPVEDMCTVLTQSFDNGELSMAECLDFHQLLINAGFETTHTLIGQSMRMIVEDPEVASNTARAISEVGPDRVIDEFLRYITPAMHFARTATRDTELGGQQIRKDDVMAMYFIAANRDPQTFTDPNRFDPWRNEPGSIVFGSGIHRCIGSALAKLELSILFEELARRDVRLELAGEPKRGWSSHINQLTQLPLRRSYGS